MKPLRRKRGALRADLSDMRAALMDPRTHTAIGIVDQPGTGSHWRRTASGDILVEVLVVPTKQEITARLGASAGQVGAGLWRVPKVGTEVGLIIPHGEIDHMSTIVCILSSGGAPARVSDAQTLLAAPDAIEIDAPAIRVGGEHADQAVIKGNARKDDEDTVLNKLSLALTEIGAGLTALGQSSTNTVAAASAVTLFQGKLAGHLSTVVKVR